MEGENGNEGNQTVVSDIVPSDKSFTAGIIALCVLSFSVVKNSPQVHETQMGSTCLSMTLS
jgi:hypothetical protein